jgi:hypothetical protein
MPDLTAKRTLVKSPPELWSELSEVERLARHLGAFGEIKITKLEPEHTVAWEGESASGTVSIEPSGWGTKVTLTAQLGDSPAPSATVEEPPPAGTAAGEGERDVPGGGEVEGEELEVSEPEAEQPESAGPEIAEPDVAESDGEQPVAEQPVAETSVAEGDWGDERVVEEPVVDQHVQAEPRRKRGFLAWLFRPRTSAQVSSPLVEPPSEPVVEKPEAGVEEPAVEEFFAEEPRPTDEHLLMAEEPAEVAEEPAEAAEEPAQVAEEPAEPAEEPAESEPPSLAEELAAVEQATPRPNLDPDRAQAILDEALDALGSAHHRPYSRG